MRRVLTFAMVCCLVLAGVPAGATAGTIADTTADGPVTAAENNSTTLTLLTYNDIQTAGAENSTLPKMVTLVEQRRAAHGNPVVVAGAGDQVSPHALSPVSQWRAPTEVLNRVDPAADVIGNHEFDFGLDAISNVTNDSEFPWLATNLVDNETGKAFDGTKDYEIVERGDVTVGFIGLLDYGATYGKTNVDFAAEGITLEDYTVDGPRTAEMLKEEKGVDVVVALAHTGVPDAKKLAEADDGAIDVIAVGDDEIHYPPNVTSGTIITEGEARAEYLGELNLTVDTDANDVTAWNGRLIDVQNASVESDEEAARIIEEYRGEVSLDSVVAESEVALDARFATNYHEESNYGNLVTDAMRWETGADVAITNAGGIRSNSVYGPGPITGGDVFNTLPFPNTVTTVEVTGAELKATLASQIVTLESETGQQYGEEISQQVSGVQFEWVPHEDAHERITDVYVGGERLDEDATYSLAVNDYMAAGGSSYPLADEPVLNDTGKLVATTVVDYMSEQGTLDPQVEGRMQRVDAHVGTELMVSDGNGKAVFRLDAPDGFDGVNGTYTLVNGQGESVAAEHVVSTDDAVVVRFDDGDVRSLTSGRTTELQLYGGYDSTTDEFVYFEYARLNADVTVWTFDRAQSNGQAAA
ncbi:bifunctional metallophosphatase/5'-nucleotidase [Halomarina rubra]|uniref:Bifunctional metallophosphatase/5'-nucleotidase n=1 Tax=Halomarina rubra TaxID=2071873 RepID=A0ABD6AYL8_9EURY|nr:bifunctional UDP-sugar hydrolase/5'-nucleotidase [Halomarina rubra]